MNHPIHAAPPARGFTLIELMITIAIIAIIASMAVPNFLSARSNANETAAISTLRNLASSQAQFRGTTAIDVDRDGVGEFGYFGELSGGTNMRGTSTTFQPPVLSASFRAVRNSRVSQSGYNFAIFLPDANGIGRAERSTGGAPGTAAEWGGWAADYCETTWCAYAWPIRRDATGTRAFFVNQMGDIMSAANKTVNGGAGYSGSSGPNPDAAFLPGSSSNAITGLVAASSVGNDGEHWVIIQ